MTSESAARSTHIAALCALTALAVALAPIGMPPSVARAAGVTAFTIMLWSTGAWPDHVTAFAFFLLALLVVGAPPEIVFSGFHSQALWLIFAGLIIGLAAQRAGLAVRLAAFVAGRAGGSYARVVTTVVVIGVLLTFVMPSSMGRTVLLLPIVLALADRLGLAEGSRGRVGLVLAAVLGAYLPSAAVLPANLPNIVLAGAAEQLYGIQLSYGRYLALSFPVLGIVKSLSIVVLIVALYGRAGGARGTSTVAAGTEAPTPDPVPGKSTPWSRDERLIATVLGVALLFWMTDFAHGIAPAWVGLAAAFVCMLPGMRLVPPETFAREINYSVVFFVAGIIGLGALVAHTGLGDELSRWLAAIAPFQEGAPMWNFCVLGLLSALVCLVTTTTGVPAVLTPLAEPLAKASGLSIETVLMTQLIGFSAFVFPYQGAPIVFAIRAAQLPLKSVVLALAILTLVTIVVLAPLQYTWLQWLHALAGS